jgi:SET domain-containing protein
MHAQHAIHYEIHYLHSVYCYWHVHSIHGYGAFAGEDIAKGKFIAEYKGEIINNEEFGLRGKHILMIL